MKWRVVGADRDTGEHRDWVIEGHTKQDAEREALKRNAVIAHVAPAGNFGIEASGVATAIPARPQRPAPPQLGDIVSADGDENAHGGWRWSWMWGWVPSRPKPGTTHRMNHEQYPVWTIASFQPIVIVEISRRAWWQVYWLVVLLAITVPIIVAIVYLLFTFCVGGVLAGALQEASRSMPRR